MRMPIPDDWDGESYCRFAVCWPNSPQWLAILRGQATEIARGWFWSETSGDLLSTLDAARQTLENNIELPEVIMACGDSQLSEIAAAIREMAAAQCCDSVPANGGVQGGVDDGAGGTIPIFGEAPPFEFEPGEVPPDFPGDLAEYTAAKCAAAAAIVTGAITTARNWAYISFKGTASLVVLALALTGGWIVIPAVGIPVLIATAILLVGTQSLLIAFADGMQDEYDRLVCAIVENDSSDGILRAIGVVVGGILILIPAMGVAAVFLRIVTGLLFSTDTLAQVFGAAALAAAPYECECEDCSSENDVRHEFETDLDGFAINTAFGSNEPLYDGVVGTWGLTWQATERLRVTNTQSIPNTKVFVARDLSHTIRAGDHLLSNATANQTVTLHIQLFSPGKQQIAGFAAGSFNNGPIDVDLSSFAGQQIGHVGIWVAKASAAAYNCEVLFVAVECEV